MKSKQIGKEKQKQTTEFARMLEENLQGIAEIQPGSLHLLRVTNTADQNYVFVSLNEGQGLIPRAELQDMDGNIIVNQGERVHAFFLRTENGEMLFTTLPKDKQAYEIARNACEQGLPFKAQAIRPIKGGFEVQIGDITAFCPASQMSGENELNLEMPFLVIEVLDKRVIVSRRAFREKERDRQKEMLQGTLDVGDVVSGPVVSIQNFGVFVDLGGIEALIPVSELAFHRVNQPGEIVTMGEEVRGRVLSVDWKDDRITLSRKSLLENPWQGKLPFAEGDIIEGTVEGIKNFGIFVSLSEGFTGLIPLAESNVPRGQNAGTLYNKGQSVRVMIQKIDRERERISLSVRKVSEADTRQEYEEYLKKQDDDNHDGQGLSSFARQLKAAIKDKK